MSEPGFDMRDQNLIMRELQFDIRELNSDMRRLRFDIRQLNLDKAESKSREIKISQRDD